MSSVLKHLVLNFLVLSLFNSLAFSHPDPECNGLPILEGYFKNIYSSNEVMSQILEKMESFKGKNEPDKALKLFRQVQGHTDRDEVFYNALIGMFADARDSATAHELFREMQLKYNPSLETYNIILEAYAHAADPVGAQSLFEELQTKGLKAGRVTYRSLFRAYARALDPKAAHQVFDKMWARFKDGQKRFQPDTMDYNTLIRAYAEKGNPELAQQLLTEMWRLRLEKGFETILPDQETYRFVLSAYLRASDRKGAHLLLEDMKAKHKEGNANLAPGTDFYHSLITAYAQSLELKKARDLLREMWESHMDIEASRIPYTEVMNAYAKASSPARASFPDEAYRLLTQAAKRNIGVDIVGCGAVLQAYVNAGRSDEKEPARIFDLLKKYFFKKEALEGPELDLHIDKVYKDKVYEKELETQREQWGYPSEVPEGIALMVLKARIRAHQVPSRILVDRQDNEALKSAILRFLKEKGYQGEISPEDPGTIQIKRGRGSFTATILR